MAESPSRSVGIVLDSSVLVAFERRRFDFERMVQKHAPLAVAAITAAELLIGVERADTPQRRARRESFVQNVLARLPIIPFDMSQARLFAHHFRRPGWSWGGDWRSGPAD